ncbi:MAG TPA: PQQ-binding-like beta-propeller repeat protein [Planctomycetota bacterium]|nr:PQQ-binding-like beta-propeller repeat protein [Planctomycetota bacterium]
MTTRIAALILVLPSALGAQDWPGWRGPKGDGTSAEKGFPVTWGPDRNVRWKTPIPGKGHSSPIVVGDRVFLTTCLEDTGERRLLCLSAADGRLLWQKEVLTSPLERKHKLNSFASSTPASDGKHVWSAFLAQDRFHVFCHDLDGNLVWKTSPGTFSSVHGFCSSPVLWKDTVIFNGDQDADAWIVALEKATGKERWRADRPNKTRSYVPPVIFELAGRPQLVLSGSKCVASYDPDTGEQIWLLDGPTEQFVASLVTTEGVLFVTGGYPKHFLIGIKPDGKGNVTATHEIWRDTRGVSYVPSPVAWGPHFYVVSDIGQASCLEASTGRRLWMQKLGRHHSASIVAAEGRLYFLDDDGTTHVVKAGDAFELLAKNEIGEEAYASPALSRGRVYIRGAKHLFCIGE